MTKEQYTAFAQFREDFRAMVNKWSKEFYSALLPLQQDIAGSSYKVETPIVYNSALDKVTKDTDIKLILVGDNPGKTEQMAQRRAYMVGMSGRLALSFFMRHRELGVDWGENVIVLNKTPVHTAKTADLRRLMKVERAAALLRESQVWMAEHTALLHKSLNSNDDQAESEGTQGVNSSAKQAGSRMIESRPQAGLSEVELWVTGYSELRRGGVFAAYRDALSSCYPPSLSCQPLLYQHFSMNRFDIDLRRWQELHTQMCLKEALLSLGESHRKDVLGM